MDFDTWNLVLLVLAAVFAIVAILGLLGDDTSGVFKFFSLFAAACVFGMWIRTDVNANEKRDGAALRQLQSEGYPVRRASTSSGKTTLHFGQCEREAFLQKTGGKWLVLVEYPDGRRIPFPATKIGDVPASCR